MKVVTYLLLDQPKWQHKFEKTLRLDFTVFQSCNIKLDLERRISVHNELQYHMIIIWGKSNGFQFELESFKEIQNVKHVKATIKELFNVNLKDIFPSELFEIYPLMKEADENR